MEGPETVNFISIVLARDSTSRLSRPLRIRVPPPAAPPRNELITTQPSASVSESFHSKTISGRLFSNFCKRSFIHCNENRVQIYPIKTPEQELCEAPVTLFMTLI